VYEENGRFVFNPGCITRQTLDMKDYKPIIYLFDTEKKEYETIYLLDNDPDVITDKHITHNEERDIRISSFVEKLQKDNTIILDFEENLLNYLQKNKEKREVKKIIMEIMFAARHMLKGLILLQRIPCVFNLEKIFRVDL